MGFDDVAKRVHERNSDVEEIGHTAPARGDDADRILRERARAEERDAAWRALWTGLIIFAGGVAATAVNLFSEHPQVSSLSFLGVVAFCFGAVQIVRGISRLVAR